MLHREYEGIVRKDKNLHWRLQEASRAKFFGRRKQETHLPGRVSSVAKGFTRSKSAGIILTRNRMENKSLQWVNKRLKGGYTTVVQVVTCAHLRMSLWEFDHSKGRLKFRLRMEKLFRLLELGRFQSDWWTWFYLYRSRALHSGIGL